MSNVNYQEPNFDQIHFKEAPNVRHQVVEKDGIAPKHYHASSIFPEYFKIDNQWHLAADSRMDSVVVIDNFNPVSLRVTEFRNLKKGDRVILGRSENASEGIYVHPSGFDYVSNSATDSFAFRQGRSRETAFSVDYDSLYELLRNEKKSNGKITWVLGTSISLDQGSRLALTNLIKAGYVDTIICGNALLAFDLEMASFNSVWGQKVFTKEQNSYFNYYETINLVREYGSLSAFVKSGIPKDGFVKACIEHDVELIIAGSIRDRYTLPESINDVYQAQDKMRAAIKETSAIIMVSAILFSIASGNMTPSFNIFDGQVRPVYMYVVDLQEFSANKLADRGTLTAKTLVTNAQDFIKNIARALT